MRKAQEGESTRGGGYFPIAAVGGLVPPREFFEHFYVRYNRVFLRFLCIWDQILVVLVTIFCWKDISCRMRNQILEKNYFQTVMIFFLQHVPLTLFHLCPGTFWQSTFSTDPWWYFKESCIPSLESFKLEHPLRIQASSRIRLR